MKKKKKKSQISYKENPENLKERILLRIFD